MSFSGEVTEWQLSKDIEYLRTRVLKKRDYLYIIIENGSYLGLEPGSN
jgi:hypothetical protein